MQLKEDSFSESWNPGPGFLDFTFSINVNHPCIKGKLQNFDHYGFSLLCDNCSGPTVGDAASQKYLGFLSEQPLTLCSP